MKVEVKESSKKAERPFPKLMINSIDKTTIALFSSPTEGTVIHSKGKLYLVGSQSQSFVSRYFEDFEGEITLSNDEEVLLRLGDYGSRSQAQRYTPTIGLY